jgi:hypothetical protein
MYTQSSGQAQVPWSQLVTDLMLLFFGVFAMSVSLAADLYLSCNHTFFARSGSITVLMSALVAYRSLTKHFEKIFLLPDRQMILRTSRNQHRIDVGALVLSIIGTLVWGYGDLLVGGR